MKIHVKKVVKKHKIKKKKKTECFYNLHFGFIWYNQVN